MKINKYQLIFLSLFFSLLVPLSALATNIIDQQQIASGAGYLFPYGYEFSQTFLPTKNNISQITTAIYSNSTQTYTVNLYQGIYNSGILIGTALTYIVGSDVGNFIFDNPINIIPEAYYYFTLSATTTTFKANGSGGYTRGQAYPNGYVDDLYFKTYYSDTFVPLLNITYPTASSTYNGSPIPITFNYSNPIGLYSQIIFNISRTSPNAQTMTPVHFYATSTNGYVNNIIFKNLINGDYKVNAYFSNWNGTPHPPATPDISFTIASSTFDDGSALIIPYGTPPESCLYDISECDNISATDFYSGITCGLKKFSIWALCPSQTSQDSLNTSYLELKNSFPFSAFFDLTNTINEAIATTTTNLNDTFDVPFITATGTFYMLPVMSSTSLPNLIGQTNNNLFRNSLKWILWCLTAFVIFITFKKI